MKDFNNILSDKEIYELFKQRLLAIDMDEALNQKLIDMETQLAFSKDLLLMPDLNKEKELLQKLSKKTGLGSMGKWLYTGLSCTLLATIFLIYNLNKNTGAKLSQPESAMASQKAIVQNSEHANNIALTNNSALEMATQNHKTPLTKQPLAIIVDSFATKEAVK